MLARDYMPAVKHGAKWLPSDLAGMVGQPVVGNIWYVDGVNGSDNGGGKSWNDAFKTLYAAHNAATDNNYDVIIVAPAGTGSGTGTDESTYGTWTFSKNLVTVVGGAAPSTISNRSRILWNTAGSTTTPLLTISGSGNRFMNVQFGTFVNNYILVKLTGDRNYFGGVHFAGIGEATAGGQATARSLWLADSDENLFEDCTIGLDTVARSAANAELEMSGETQRNLFRNCRFLSFASNAGHLFVKAASADDIDRFAIFDSCLFLNAIKSTATTMTVAMSLNASVGGAIILQNSWLFGATDWANDFTNVYTAGSMAAATAATAGLMAVAA